MRLKSRSSGLIGLFLLLILPVSLWAIQNLKLDPRKKAAETDKVSPNTFSQPTNFVVENEVIVKFKSDSLRLKSTTNSLDLNKTAASLNSFESSSLPAAITKINNQYPITSLEKIFKQVNPAISLNTANKKLQGTYKITFDKNIPVETVINGLKNNPEVEYAEPNIILHTFYIPQDPRYTEQWAHQKTQAESGWDIEKGKPEAIIAVLDTGVDYNHEDLKDSMLADCTNGCPIGTGYDFVDTYPDGCADTDCQTIDNDPSDNFGHGTHCAGIIAAANNDKGVIGICPGCKIMPIRAGYTTTGGGGSFDTDAIAQGIIYAADNGAKVISMSFGGGDSQTMKNALDYAYSKGLVLIAAAGNNGMDMPSYPAAYDNVIAVSSTGPDDQIAYYSNYGTWVDVAAPGGDSSTGKQILSTVPKTGILFDPSGYMELQGTSMATPYVAGVAGLILSKTPNISNTLVKQILRRGTEVNSQWSKYLGTGRVNILKTLQTDPTINAEITSPIDGQLVSGNINITGAAFASDFKNYELYYGSGIYPTEYTKFYDSSSAINVAGGGLNYPNFDTGLMSDGENVIKLVVNTNHDSSAEYRAIVKTKNIELTNPMNNDIYRPGEIIDITGQVFVDNAQYSFQFSPGKTDQWSSAGITNVSNGNSLAQWNTTGLTGGYYRLRMTLTRNGRTTYRNIEQLYFDPTLKEGWPQKIYYGEQLPGNYFNWQYFTYPNSKKDSATNEKTSVLTKNQFDYMVKSKSYYSPGMLQPLVADIDKDNNKEIIVFKSDVPPKLIVYRNNGTVMWEKGISSTWFNVVQNAALPVISDINNDGYLEILVHIVGFIGNYDVGSELQAYDYRGNLIWSTVTNPTQFAVNMSAADLNLDGNKEIIIKGSDGNPEEVFVIGHSGKILSQWDLPNTSWGATLTSSPAIGNFDDDPELEIVVAGPSQNAKYDWDAGKFINEGFVNAYNLDGTSLPGWPVILPGVIFASPVIADLNGDGSSEIIIGLQYSTVDGEVFPNNNYGGMYVLDKTGHTLSGWPAEKGWNFWSTPAIADINNDGRLEFSTSRLGFVTYIFDPSGNILPGWPQNTCWQDYSGSIMGDIDNDNNIDLITTAGNHWCGGGVYGWNKNGVPLSGFPKGTEVDAQSAATLDDIDQNGKLELITSSDYDMVMTDLSYKMRGSLYVWDLKDSSATSSLPWPRFHHDIENTGNYGIIINNCPNHTSGNLDCDSNGLINETDLSLLLKAWSPISLAPGNISDLNGDGFVNDSDLQILLGNWKTQ